MRIGQIFAVGSAGACL